MKIVIKKSFFLLALLTLVSPAFSLAQKPEEYQYTKVKIGSFNSRAIFGAGINSDKAKKPVVIMIPGSGPNGPEEMMEPSLTLDNKYHSIFEDIAKPLNRAGFNTLQLGKPGIEFFNPQKPETQFYDLKMTQNLKWSDLIENVRAAVDYAKSRPDVDPKNIILLGHSQGTQVAVDYATNHNDIATLILLGYSANDTKTILEWQFYRRVIDKFIATDVDTNKDHIITDSEAKKWPGVNFGLSSKKHRITFAEIEKIQKESKEAQAIIEQTRKALSQDGVFDRGPIYDKTLSLKIPVYVFTGELDIQTPPEEAMELENRAKKAGNSRIKVVIVPGVGHGFSPPRPPRKQRLLDLTIGPVDPTFQDLLFKTALAL
jgi:dienelactone hydrolase